MSAPFDFGRPSGGFGDSRHHPPLPSEPADVGGFGSEYHDGVAFGVDGPGAMVTGRPPVVWLWLGVAAATLGIVLALIFDEVEVAIPAWVLSGPVAIGMLACFITGDTKSRSAPVYAAQRHVPWLYRGLLLLAAIGVLASAWRIAWWVGHL